MRLVCNLLEALYISFAGKTTTTNKQTVFFKRYICLPHVCPCRVGITPLPIAVFDIGHMTTHIGHMITHIGHMITYFVT